MDARKYIDRWAVFDNCRHGSLFSFLSCLASAVQAVIFFFMIFGSIFARELFHHSLVGAVLSVFVIFFSFGATVIGRIANANKSNKKFVLVSMILCIASATMSFCCINHPHAGRIFIYVLPAMFSGILNLIAFVFYANFWAKSPISSAELHTYRDMPLDDRYSKDKKDRKKFALAMLISLMAFAITISAVIPTEYFKNCDIVYNEIVRKMGKAGEYYSMEHSRVISLNSYIKELPKGYRDTEEIQKQYDIYLKRENEFRVSRDGIKAREALAQMYDIKIHDDRWDFSGYCENTFLYCDATWKYGDYYLTIGSESSKQGTLEFSTNLPFAKPDEIDEEIGTLSIEGTYREYDAKKNSTRWGLGYNLRYEYDGETYDFSVDVLKVLSISYSLEDEEFILHVYCYATRDYYDMRLA